MSEYFLTEWLEITGTDCAGNWWSSIPGSAPTAWLWHLGTQSVVTTEVGLGGWLDLGTLNDSVIPWITLLLQEGDLVSPLEPSGRVQV